MNLLSLMNCGRRAPGRNGLTGMICVPLRRTWILIVLASLVVVTASGCIGLVPSPFRPSPGPQKSPQLQDLAEAFDVVCRNYRLGPEDRISLTVYPRWETPVGSYKLAALDKISLKVLIDPSLNEQLIVRPDGMVTVQGIGDIKAAGLAPEELARRIEQKLKDAGVFSESLQQELGNQKLVTVQVTAFDQKLDVLAKSLANLAGGQARTIVVKPDGTIDLPLVEERVLAAGHTIQEVERTVNRAYRKRVANANISLALDAAQSRNFYIMGQVGGPGSYPITQPITILHALAVAGGPIVDRSDLTSVILISRNINGKPIGRRIDVKRMLDVGDLGSNILVKPYDVIYVPKTYIADVQLFVEQYLNTITGFTGFYETLANISTRTAR